MGGARDYLEAFFEADYERCDDIVRADARAAVDDLLEVAGSAIRLTASRIGRDPGDILSTLFAQARRERPVSDLVEDEVTARTLLTEPSSSGAEGGAYLDGHDPAVVLAEVAGLVAIVTQGLAVITGDTLPSVLDALHL